MNIDDMKFGELKAIAAMFQNTTSANPHTFVGKYVIARCYSAGVHAGIVVSVSGDTAILSNSRRLWSWTAKEGVALSGVAQKGLKSGKVDVVNPEIYLTGVIELIPTSDDAKRSIENA